MPEGGKCDPRLERAGKEIMYVGKYSKYTDMVQA